MEARQPGRRPGCVPARSGARPVRKALCRLNAPGHGGRVSVSSIEGCYIRDSAFSNPIALRTCQVRRLPPNVYQRTALRPANSHVSELQRKCHQRSRYQCENSPKWKARQKRDYSSNASLSQQSLVLVQPRGLLRGPANPICMEPVGWKLRDRPTVVGPPIWPPIAEWPSDALDSADHSGCLCSYRRYLVYAEESSGDQLHELLFVVPCPGHVRIAQQCPGHNR